MERLTNIGSNGEIWITDNDETRRNGRKESAYKKLAEYENLEEQGLLLRLPCKVGTKVYAINQIIDYGEVGDESIYYYSIIEREFQIYMMMDYGKLVFGKTVFLTKAEAEQKLKEMESDWDGKVNWIFEERVSKRNTNV